MSQYCCCCCLSVLNKYKFCCYFMQQTNNETVLPFYVKSVQNLVEKIIIDTGMAHGCFNFILDFTKDQTKKIKHWNDPKRASSWGVEKKWSDRCPTMLVLDKRLKLSSPKECSRMVRSEWKMAALLATTVLPMALSMMVEGGRLKFVPREINLDQKRITNTKQTTQTC